MNSKMSFPGDFLFGTATSAYQVEGGWDADGKGLSIWDRFASRPGKIQDGSDGRRACEHYSRYREDVALMKELNLGACRFSVSWPRILPDGTGRVNSPGLDHYDRYVDALLEAEIQPMVTLYHWDLPQALQDRGGWANRDMASWFSDYTRLVAERLGDRVRLWITLNEPWMFVFIGHMLGWHAPGRKNPWISLKALHNALLAHGTAVRVLRELCPEAQVGISLNLSPFEAESDDPRDLAARDRADLFSNRLLLDPLFGRGYPEEMRRLLRLFFPRVREGDMELIAEPLDFLGMNLYTREFIRHDPKVPLVRFWSNLGDVPDSDYTRDGKTFTDMGYEVYPPSLSSMLFRLRDEYGNPPVYITENGSSFTDTVAGGEVKDPLRIGYLTGYLAEAARACAEGCRLKGYFVWTLLDNFEWSFGYRKRHGLIHVDFETQERIIKESGRVYSRIIREHREVRS